MTTARHNPIETTTTQNVPVYFPQRKRKKRKKEMNEALLAIELVERYGFDHSEALELVIEGDMDKAADKMAKKAAPDDPKKQAAMKEKFKKQMEKKGGKAK